MNQKRRKGVESYDHTSLVETMSVFQTALVTKLLFFFNNNMKLQHFLSNCYFHRNPQICLVVFNNNMIKAPCCSKYYNKIVFALKSFIKNLMMLLSLTFYTVLISNTIDKR